MKRSEAVENRQSIENESLREQFAQDVLSGLSSPRKSLPCKYIYDDAGSELFSRITDLPEYYPTRCEAEILRTHQKSLTAAVGAGPLNVVELGAGDGQKTCVLIDGLKMAGSDFTYVPMDISEAAVFECEESVYRAFPGIRVEGMVSDYFEGLRWLSRQNHALNIVLFLGSTIGNFPPQAQGKFLGDLRKALNSGDMVLIGFDLVKDIDVMIRAYNDDQGVTAQFNKNILARINRELGGEFDLDGFRYFSTWDAFSRGIQSFLVSKRPQKVAIEALSKVFMFESWEAIHTESSHKFTLSQIRKLAADHCFAAAGQYFDSRQYFVDCLWRAV